jgi:hypothetical protein
VQTDGTVHYNLCRQLMYSESLSWANTECSGVLTPKHRLLTGGLLACDVRSSGTKDLNSLNKSLGQSTRGFPPVWEFANDQQTLIIVIRSLSY